MQDILRRASFFIDGFSLYYGIRALKQDHLKWCDLSALAQLIIPSRTQVLNEIFFTTAFVPNDHKKTLRHRAYNGALIAAGVQVLEGTFVTGNRLCHHCSREIKQLVEKQSDINVALALLDAAYRNAFDHAYLLTADSDHAATVRWLSNRFPEKALTVVVPPGKERSKLIDAWSKGNVIRLNRDHKERCLFPAIVEGPNGPIRRPREYDPPTEVRR